MRTMILAGAAAMSFVAGASAAPLTAPQAEPMMQQADWYCGPQCQQHRVSRQGRVEHRQGWRESHQYPYRYNYTNQYYRGY
jgi:hypothetical protein